MIVSASAPVGYLGIGLMMPMKSELDMDDSKRSTSLQNVTRTGDWTDGHLRIQKVSDSVFRMDSFSRAGRQLS
jgi:hypothetical protein